MLFNSLTFLLFATLFFTLWPLLKRHMQVRWVYLTIASFVFYGWWDWRFIFLIIASGLLDYYSALAMQRFPEKRRLFLMLSIVGNVGSLAIFKYLTFLSENINSLLWSLVGWQIPLVEVALPVGISFYTFQSMSYTIDVYREKMEPTRNIFHFFAYLALFPQLVAGPIVRARQLLPQLARERKTSEADRWQGTRLIAIGFFRKVVLADNLAPAVNLAFGSAEAYGSALWWWLAVSMFAFQIYFDFSGYSDIARGLGRWMGFRFPENFRHPYLSHSLREFWTRWHISLSTWFRDYLYIPLGGSRKGKWRGLYNLWVVMLVAGLWHGASWNFVIWGGLFAFWISMERLTGLMDTLQKSAPGRMAAWALVIVQVWTAWVFFRAETLEGALSIVTDMFFGSLTLPPLPGPFYPALFALSFGILAEIAAAAPIKKRWQRINARLAPLEPVWITLLFLGSIFLRGPGSAFIYFQF